jgi:(4S)-4-hydroxy-5-phosphonooxypentane-2,3-dione isomerase
MQVLVVEFRVRREHAAAFEAAIVANAEASRTLEPGCRQFDVCRDAQRPEVFMLYELYDDDAAIAAHLAAPHFRSFDAATRDWVEHKTVWRCARIAPR